MKAGLAMTREARDEAVQQLDAALFEQDRLGERYRSALGTSTEFAAYVRLRAVSDEVVAREAWLNSIDDDGPAGRAWINGREVGGPGSLFVNLEDSYD
jgi:hypothetical protein